MNPPSFKEVKWKLRKKGSGEIVKIYNNLKRKEIDNDSILSEIKELYRKPKFSHLSRWNKIDDKGIFKDADLSREGGSKGYTIINPHTGENCIIPNRGWGKSYEELMRLQAEDLIWYGDENTPPGLKDYIESDDEVVPDSFFYYDNSVDTREMKSTFGELVFQNPKPAELLEVLISLNVSNTNNDLILDFFAGSGTTAHAVMAQNAADNGNRRYILVQLPEPLDPNDKNQKTASDFCDKIKKPRTIAELTKERVRRAASKIKDENPLFAGDTGFRVYKLATSNFKQWEATRENLPEQMTMQLDSVKDLRGDFALFTEYLLKRGLDLCSPLQTDILSGKTVYSYGQGTLIACLSNISSSEAANLGHELAKLKNALSPETKTTFLFKDGGFEDCVAKLNLQETLTQRIDKKYIDAMRSL